MTENLWASAALCCGKHFPCWDLCGVGSLLGPRSSPETSVTNFQPKPGNMAEERKPEIIKNLKDIRNKFYGGRILFV
jgi:hypothetical protein